MLRLLKVPWQGTNELWGASIYALICQLYLHNALESRCDETMLSFTKSAISCISTMHWEPVTTTSERRLS